MAKTDIFTDKYIFDILTEKYIELIYSIITIILLELEITYSR